MGRPLQPVYAGPFREVYVIVDAEPCMKQTPIANETCWAEHAHVQIVTDAGSQTIPIPIAPWINDARMHFSEMKPGRVFPPGQPTTNDLEDLPPGKVTAAIDLEIIYADAIFHRRFAALEGQGILACWTWPVCGASVDNTFEVHLCWPEFYSERHCGGDRVPSVTSPNGRNGPLI
jgi:hypothetical protein